MHHGLFFLCSQGLVWCCSQYRSIDIAVHIAGGVLQYVFILQCTLQLISNAVHIAVNIKSSVFLVLQIAVHIAGGVLHCVVHWCRSQLAVKLRQLSIHVWAAPRTPLCRALSALPLHCLCLAVSSAQVSSPQTTLFNSTVLL